MIEAYQVVDIIRYKRWMFDLYEQGAFGNRPISWPTLDAFEKEARKLKPDMHFSLRYKESSSPYFRADMTADQLKAWVKRCLARGADRALMHVTESPPHHRIFLQGEVCESYDHLWLSYSTIPGLTCREAMLSDHNHARGVLAHTILKDSLDPPSWDNLWKLLSRWPDHAIEFSVFNLSLGVLMWNTIFWEVRLY